MSKELWKINESLKDVVARLVGVKREIKQSDELTREVLANVAQSTKNLKKKNRDKEIIGAIKDIPKTEFPKVQEVKIKNPVKKIEVEKPSWYKGFKLDKDIFDPLLSAIGGLVNRVFSVRVENLPKNPKGFLPVRLTDGKFWLGLPSGGGGGPKVVGIKDSEDNRISPVASSTNGVIYNITIADINTQYSQALPSGVKKFTFQNRADIDIRWALVTGKVATPTAPYFTLKAGMNHYEDNLNLSGKTLYVASGTASQVVELIIWN